MGTVYRKVYTQPLPDNAQVFERNGEKMAMWMDFKGKKHIDQITTGRRGQIKLLRQSPTFIAQYRDADGQVVIESTGCRDENAARHMLAERMKQVELIRAGVLNDQQVRTANHAQIAVEEHISKYLQYLESKTVRGKKISQAHRTNVARQLEVLVTDCRFKRLHDITRERMESWMRNAERDGTGARTRNSYRSAAVAFCGWCLETDRLTSNPLIRVCVADESSDRRRTRRALSEDELVRLFIAAQLRPIAEYGRQSVPLPPAERKGHKSWRKATLSFKELEQSAQRGRVALKEDPELISELEWLGRERSLTYKVLVMTGLRKGELASISASQCHLDGKNPFLELKAKDEKAGRGALLPLRSDLVQEIHQFMREKLARLQHEARKSNKPVPARLPATIPLFDMPRSMVGVFDRDLAVAGIEKRDDRGRTVDIHSLRHTYATFLVKMGVPPRTVQALMRHSSINLTMNYYVDISLLDTASAINVLPKFTSAVTGENKTVA